MPPSYKEQIQTALERKKEAAQQRGQAGTQLFAKGGRARSPQRPSTAPGGTGAIRLTGGVASEWATGGGSMGRDGGAAAAAADAATARQNVFKGAHHVHDRKAAAVGTSSFRARPRPELGRADSASSHLHTKYYRCVCVCVCVCV